MQFFLISIFLKGISTLAYQYHHVDINILKLHISIHINNDMTNILNFQFSSIFDIFSLLWRTLDIFSTSTFLKLGGVGTDEEMYDADITPINKIVSDLT